MATYHLALSPVHAGASDSASAYRRRVERYASRGGYEGGGVVGWTGDPEDLWRTAEAAEVPARRRAGHRPQNRRVAYSLVVAIPHELDERQRLALIRGFALAIKDEHGVAVQYDLHSPGPGSDPRQFHAHLLLTSRRVSAGLVGEKAREMTGPKGVRRLREIWEDRANKALAAAGRGERVSRDRKAMGMARPHLPIRPYKAGIRVEAPAVVEAAARRAAAEAAAAAKELAAAEMALRVVERAITLGPRTGAEPAPQAPARAPGPAVPGRPGQPGQRRRDEQR